MAPLSSLIVKPTTSSKLEVKSQSFAPMSETTSFLTIGELAERAGVATSALRFYEARGLIASQRTSGNQRRYPRAMLRRVALIRAA